jgi:DNA processing protein
LMMRDRLIAALAHAVIVIEAGDPSGSLDTAQHALKLKRRVLAVPGSPGTEKLIAEGAEILDPSKADIDELAKSILSVDVDGIEIEE